MTRWIASTLPAFAALALVGCGSDTPLEDAGSGGDAGVDASGAIDGGGGADAEPGADAGGSMDASASDAGVADAHIDWPDGGGISDPAWVDLTVGPVGSCPGFTPCGGDVVGTWDLNGGCFEIDIESAIARCPGARVTRRGRGRGRVVFEDSSAHRVAESIVEADTFFPMVCTAFYSCAMLETAMAGLWTEAHCTSMPSGDCNCTARQITFIDDVDLYSIAGNEIVGGVSGKRWEYCIAGSRFDYRDSSPTGTREPGDIELVRR